MANKVVHYFFNTHMALGHAGLSKIAKKGGVPVDELKPGEFIMFVNKPVTAFKLFAAGNVFSYYKNPTNRPLDWKATTLVPQFYDGEGVAYPRALEARLKEHMRTYYGREIE